MARGEDYPLGAELGGVKTQYTAALVDIVKSLMAQSPPSAEPNARGLKIRCWETPGSDLYIGVDQVMEIRADPSQVAAVLDDFAHYQELFPDYSQIKVLSHSGNKYLTFWEQRIPLFFIPNIKYEMIYLVDSSVPGKRVYRYQLHKTGTIKASDGFILLQKLGQDRTLYQEYDFFDAEWGPAKVLGKNRIWRDSIEGVYVSDIAIKLKSENPAWPHKKALSEAQRQVDGKAIEECVAKRQSFVAGESMRPGDRKQ